MFTCGERGTLLSSLPSIYSEYAYILIWYSVFSWVPSVQKKSSNRHGLTTTVSKQALNSTYSVAFSARKQLAIEPQCTNDFNASTRFHRTYLIWSTHSRPTNVHTQSSLRNTHAFSSHSAAKCTAQVPVVLQEASTPKNIITQRFSRCEE